MILASVEPSFGRSAVRRSGLPPVKIGKGGDTVGNPRRAQISRFELFELVLFVETMDEGFPVTVPSPLSGLHFLDAYMYMYICMCICICVYMYVCIDV